MHRIGIVETRRKLGEPYGAFALVCAELTCWLGLSCCIAKPLIVCHDFFTGSLGLIWLLDWTLGPGFFYLHTSCLFSTRPTGSNKATMASIVGRPLNRLRRSDTYKPLHERWGDVAISAPTDGSWNQFDNPHQTSHRTLGYGPGFVPEHPPRGAVSHTEENVPSTRSTKRQSTFSMSTLNPRRLSVRLAPRSKHAVDSTIHELTGPDLDQDRRTEFAYKPIHQDYPTEVAEHVATHDHPSPRFRYIPATPRYAEDMGMPSPYASSSSSSTSFSRSRESVRLGGAVDRRDRDRHTMYSDDLNEEDEDEYCSYRPDRSSSRLSRSGFRRSADYSQRASSLFAGRTVGASSSEKNRYRSSARYLTTDMVPDADDIYG